MHCRISACLNPQFTCRSEFLGKGALCAFCAVYSRDENMIDFDFVVIYFGGELNLQSRTLYSRLQGFAV